VRRSNLRPKLSQANVVVKEEIASPRKESARNDKQWFCVRNDGAFWFVHLLKSLKQKAGVKMGPQDKKSGL
jgi:hypothetical protein